MECDDTSKDEARPSEKRKRSTADDNVDDDHPSPKVIMCIISAVTIR